MQLATGIAVYANSKLKKGHKAYKESDFYVVDKLKPRRRMSTIEMRDYCKNLTLLMGGDVIDGRLGQHKT